mmetsp:Transcript_30292/g.78654  ORF Transcript_30292/g.78654 Transcript_30292/m.78654 type:complete len:215 (+) Transcript_30292:2104-2748(+)
MLLQGSGPNGILAKVARRTLGHGVGRERAGWEAALQIVQGCEGMAVLQHRCAAHPRLLCKSLLLLLPMLQPLPFRGCPSAGERAGCWPRAPPSHITPVLSKSGAHVMQLCSLCKLPLNGKAPVAGVSHCILLVINRLLSTHNSVDHVWWYCGGWLLLRVPDISLHAPFAFHLHTPCGFKWVVGQQCMRSLTDLDAAIWAGGFHAAGRVHGVTKH